MSLDQYYKTLGLNPGSSQAEIRKQYRRLVMKYHPDKNPDPLAQVEFIRIKEAYEVLTGKKAVTVTRPKAKQKEPAGQKKPTNEERVKAAQQRYREQVYHEHIENERYFNQLTKGPKWKTIQVITILGIVISIGLGLDLVLPHHFEETEVQAFNLNIGALGVDGQQLSLIETKNDGSFFISKLTYPLYGESPKVDLETTWIFHNPMRIVSTGKLDIHRYDIHFSYFSFSLLLIAIFLVPTVLMIYKKKTVRFTLLFHFSYYFIGILIMLFLLTGSRWAHLLTMGYL